MLFEGGFTFRNFLADAFAIFMFVLWFWLFVSVASDLFRRNDLSGWAKVLWVIALVFFSYIGIFAYILTQGRGMAERTQARAQQSRDDLRQIVGFSVADEIEKLDRLKSTGSISDQEYTRLSEVSSVAGALSCGRKHGENLEGSRRLTKAIDRHRFIDEIPCGAVALAADWGTLS